MEALEAMVADVILMHPEYHALLENELSDLDKDYTPDQGQTNPFLHMGMHIALSEQIATNRPIGITGIYQQLLMKHGESHKAHHLMMECLGESLWQAQRNGLPPDENDYLNCLNNLINNI